MNQITGDDFVAVSFLGVDVLPMAAIGLMRDEKADVDGLFSRIPANVLIWGLDGEGYEELLGIHSPAQELWEVITRRNGQKGDIGLTTASKTMARKRPHVIIIVDRVITNLIGQGNYWGGWREALTDGTGLLEKLETLRRDSGVIDLSYNPSLLRLMDTILWQEGRHMDDLNLEIDATLALTQIP